MSKIKNWNMSCCKGRFYVRCKNNTIRYRRWTERQSLSLPYNNVNHKIAADIIKAEENPEIYNLISQPQNLKFCGFFYAI